MRPLKVLVVEDDPNVLLGCVQALELEGISAVGAPSVEQALKQIRAEQPAVVISDIRLPGKDGMTLLKDLQEVDSDLPVILITGHGDIALAVQAMKSGAYDFIEKPFSPDFLVEAVRRALDKRTLVLEIRALRAQLKGKNPLGARIIGMSHGIEHVRQMVSELADTNASLLIHGETGTGKELIARCLHEASNRRDGHFVAINCGGLPETLVESELFGHEAGAFTGASKRRIGKIEYANGGTLFLDEIESMPLSVQVKLLRVLQERTLERLGGNTPIPVDFRIVAATKDDLVAMADAGRFRADLYYRLSVAAVLLPPLRTRREDIPLLFEHFLLQASASHERPVPEISQAKMRQLMTYTWPGNVRELRNVADRCVLGIEAGYPPFGGSVSAAPLGLPQAVEVFERSLILDALRRSGGNLTQASQALQIPKTTLHDKMKKHSLLDINR